MKCNVMDMAVGVIIGGAFGKIVTSLVNDVLMPIISLPLGSTNFSDLSVTFFMIRRPPRSTPAVAEVVWKYGAFLQQCLDFIILAFCVFLMVKVMNKLTKKKEAAPAPAPEPPKPTKDQELLTEIRDLLKEKR